MAAADLIATALIELECEAAELRFLLATFNEINPDAPPVWLITIEARCRPVHDRIAALGEVVRRDALPLLKDMAGVHKPSGGMGAMAPMVTKVVASQSAPSRT